MYPLWYVAGRLHVLVVSVGTMDEGVVKEVLWILNGMSERVCT